MKCFSIHEKYKKLCKKNTCRHWVDHGCSMNCILLASKNGPMTLQEIGGIFNVTRMRICQLEKRILQKMEIIVNEKID
tara:strand:- start:2401 stop:2634 length:234 start_codon:yes stop_codon:yes gene_type:complete